MKSFISIDSKTWVLVGNETLAYFKALNPNLQIVAEEDFKRS